MQIVLTISSVLLSLCTLSGVIVHDAHFDQVASSTTHFQVQDATALSTGTHPHPEHQNSTPLKGFSYASPSYPAERSKYKRFLLQNAEPRGRHAFDNSYLPLIA